MSRTKNMRLADAKFPAVLVSRLGAQVEIWAASDLAELQRSALELLRLHRAARFEVHPRRFGTKWHGGVGTAQDREERSAKVELDRIIAAGDVVAAFAWAAEWISDGSLYLQPLRLAPVVPPIRTA